MKKHTNWDDYLQESDKIFENRLNLFEKRIKRALRIGMLFTFGSCVTFAALINIFIYFHG